MFSILVVEDDKNLRKLMCAALKQNGYMPYPAVDGFEALDEMDKVSVDLIISDIMMPNMDGYELVEQLRNAGFDMPVLFVTAKDSFKDKQRGFMLGVDDYMVKPINIDEMILRVGALLRRAKLAVEKILTVGSCTLNYDAFTVSFDGKQGETIPNKEFMLLFKLLSYPEQIFTRRQLLDELWGLEAESDERTVDVHIKRLRERFIPNDDFDIVTVRGLGYKAVPTVK
ncbi:MAG: response regulator transcription factor [Ruminococcus sp.]|nr:response regulator transcription factor [Ruminococcus sp.]